MKGAPRDRREKPFFDHNCPKCKFIYGEDTPNLQWEKIDWYICYGPGEGYLGASILGRYDNDGPDYVSWPVGILLDTMVWPIMTLRGEVREHREVHYAARALIHYLGQGILPPLMGSRR